MPERVHCSAYVDELVGFITHHQWLLEEPVGNFVLSDMWQSVPKEWQAPLLEVPDETIATGELEGCHLPQSLMDFYHTCLRLAMSKEPKETHANVASTHHQVLFLGMCPKKRQEVTALSSVVAEVCKRSGTPFVVDVGAGEGYLSTQLHFTHGLSVTAIEADESIARRAAVRTAKIAGKLQKWGLASCCPSEAETAVTAHLPRPFLHHTVCLLTSSTTDEEFLRLVSCDEKPGSDQRVCLAGLHACGRLSCLMYRWYRDWPHARCIVNVPCCYFKMAGDAPLEGGSSLFPISERLRRRGFTISYEGLKLACESLRTWRGQGDRTLRYHLKHSAYWAALRWLLSRLDPGDYQQYNLRGQVKFDLETGTFAQFTQNAFPLLRGLGPEVHLRRPSAADLQEICTQLDPLLGRKVARFQFLRALMSTVLESAIVLDRFLYLKEGAAPGDHIEVLPIFDEGVSPRNFCVIAIKADVP
eukprot:GGOE01044046.1.p1 GENE.GGOE01044046.1~~GGOE01044046.1.p1  ORF type:complete len:472 (-),score=128.34 GGOE01044046.1:79-1494(-)